MYCSQHSLSTGSIPYSYRGVPPVLSRRTSPSYKPNWDTPHLQVWPLLETRVTPPPISLSTQTNKLKTWPSLVLCTRAVKMNKVCMERLNILKADPPLFSLYVKPIDLNSHSRKVNLTTSVSSSYMYVYVLRPFVTHLTVGEHPNSCSSLILSGIYHFLGTEMYLLYHKQRLLECEKGQSITFSIQVRLVA